MNKKISSIINYILNQATEKEIGLINAALTQRKQFPSAPQKQNLGDMVARNTASIRDRMSLPVDQIHNSVREMVTRIIKQNAPNISQRELDVLLNQWVPSRKSKPQEKIKLPPDVTITMVRQFIRLSIGKMSKAEDMKLRKEIRDWPQRYWNSFSENIQMCIAVYLKGKIDEEPFWNTIFHELGIKT